MAQAEGTAGSLRLAAAFSGWLEAFPGEVLLACPFHMMHSFTLEPNILCNLGSTAVGCELPLGASCITTRNLRERENHEFLPCWLFMHVHVRSISGGDTWTAGNWSIATHLRLSWGAAGPPGKDAEDGAVLKLLCVVAQPWPGQLSREGTMVIC